MKFNQLGDFGDARWINGLRRRKPLIHQLLVLRVTLTILMIPSGIVADATTAPENTRLSIETARAVETELGAVFRTQAPNGNYVLPDPMRGFETYPLLASAALDVFRATHDTPVLSQASYSIARYYRFLMTSADRDGDRLVETAAPWAARKGPMEDPAFNSLLALDVRNLARMNLELRRMPAALYWYDTGRMLERATVAVFYDAEANYFFPRDPVSGRSVRSLNPVAALPASFPDALGENCTDKVTYHVVRWASEAAAPSATVDDQEARAVERLSAIDVLRHRGHDPIVAALGGTEAPPTGGAVTRYALERATIPAPLFDRVLPLDLMFLMARGSQKLTDVQIVQLERSLPLVKALAVAEDDAPAKGVALDAAETAIRTVYAATSTLREKLRTRAFFSEDDRSSFVSGDPTVAAQRLLDDVLAVTRRAETRLQRMRFEPAGIRVNAQLAADAVVTGESITMRWEVTTGVPTAWKSITAGVFGETQVAINKTTPVRVAPATPLRFATRHTVRQGAGILKTTTFTLMLEDSLGTRRRYYVDRSVYVNPPVDVVAHFPAGRTIQNDVVPIEIRMKRHSTGSFAAQYFWFSPAGLKLKEGANGTISFGASDSTGARLHVEIPSPCRPGLFPFTLKFYSNDHDAGTITSSLFKAYQWTYVGPFAASGGLDKVCPPEKGVNLLQRYDGAGGKAQWHVVPDVASGSRGEISLRGLAKQTGVYYLYTVVACAYETDVQAQLSSNCRAALYVNGRRAAVTAGAARDSTSATVHLDADKNHILIKLVGDANARVWFALGDDGNLAADEFDNNLLELAGGYRELTARELGTGTAPQESRRLITLHFQDPEAKTVAVVGNFNGWSPEANPMKKVDEGWELTLSLAPGRYAYRFLVDQRKQVLDPSSKIEEPDGYGGKNSVMVVER
jgi:Glycogen recognition site of AMP-activated protein kinase